MRFAVFLLAFGFTGAVAQDGATVYKTQCAQCHETGVGRAPTPDGLKRMMPEGVRSALMQGVMSVQGAQLTRPEVDAVSTYVTGKQFAPPAPEKFPCPAGSPDLGQALDGPHWNGWGVDATNQRAQPAEMAGLTPEQVPHLKLRWAFGFSGAMRAFAQPSVAGGRVFVGGSDRKVYSLDARTGCVYWAFLAEANVRTAISFGKIGSAWAAYFGDMSGRAYAVDAATGKLIWVTRVEDYPGAVVTGAPTLYGGKLFVPMSSLEEVTGGDAHYECCRFRGSVTALDATSGRRIWKSYTIAQAPKPTRKNNKGVQEWGPSGAAVISAPTVDPVRRAVYVTDGDSYSDPAAKTSDSFLAFSMDTGKLLWSRQVTEEDTFNNSCGTKDPTNCPDKEGPDADFLASPMLVKLPGGKRALVAGQKAGMVHAVDPDQQGKILWQVRLGDGDIRWGAAADDHNAYVPYGGMKVGKGRAFDPLVGGGIYALDLATGRKVWFTAPGKCGPVRGCSPGQSAAATLIPGVVFSGSVDGHLRAYATADGRVLGDYDSGQSYKTVNGVIAHGGSMDGPGPTVVGGMLFVNSGYGLGGGTPGNVLLAFSVDGK